MDFLINIFNIIFYEPLLNGLVFLIGFLPFNDVGIAIVVLTIIVRFIIFPFSHKSVKTQAKMKVLEPDIKKIKKDFKDNPQEQAKKTMELYKEHGINPLSGCLTAILQIPIIIALYRVFLAGFDFSADNLYSFVTVPEFFQIKFLGIIDMAQKNYFLAFLAGLSQFFQMKLALPPPKKGGDGSFKDNFAKSMNMQARYIMPIFIFFIGIKFSSAIALYWTTMNVFAIIHEIFVRRTVKKIY